MKNFEILPRENQEMRSFYYYLGTGKTRESCWFRPLEEEVSIPLVDWNDESEYCDSESVHDDTETESTCNMDVDDSSKDNSADENEKKTITVYFQDLSL